LAIRNPAKVGWSSWWCAQPCLDRLRLTCLKVSSNEWFQVFPPSEMAFFATPHCQLALAMVFCWRDGWGMSKGVESFAGFSVWIFIPKQRMPLSTTRLLPKLTCKLTLLSTTLANRCIHKGHPSRPVFRVMNMTVACFATEIGAKKWMRSRNDASAVSFQHSLYKNTSVVVCKHSARVHVRNRLQNRMWHLSKVIVLFYYCLRVCIITQPLVFYDVSQWLTSQRTFFMTSANGWRHKEPFFMTSANGWRHKENLFMTSANGWRHKTFCFFMTSWEKSLQNFKNSHNTQLLLFRGLMMLFQQNASLLAILSPSQWCFQKRRSRHCFTTQYIYIVARTKGSTLLAWLALINNTPNSRINHQFYFMLTVLVTINN
jgi:hypothetical protein